MYLLYSNLHCGSGRGRGLWTTCVLISYLDAHGVTRVVVAQESGPQGECNTFI